MSEKSRSRRLSYVASLLALVVSFAALGGVLYNRRETRKHFRKIYASFDLLDKRWAQIDALERELSSLRIDMFRSRASGKTSLVDLRYRYLQDIGDGFAVGDLSVSEYPEGINVSGYMFNRTEHTRTNTIFRITVSGQTKEFRVGSVSPVYGTRFSVDIPDVPVNEAKVGSIEYLRSPTESE